MSLVDTHTHACTLQKWFSKRKKNLPHLPPSCDVPLSSDTDQVGRCFRATCTRRCFLKWRRGRTGGRQIGEQIVTDMLISSPSLTTGEKRERGVDQSKGDPPSSSSSFLPFLCRSGRCHCDQGDAECCSRSLSHHHHHQICRIAPSPRRNCQPPSFIFFFLERSNRVIRKANSWRMFVWEGVRGRPWIEDLSC